MKALIKYAIMVAVFAALAGAVFIAVKSQQDDSSTAASSPEPSVNVVLKAIEPSTMPDAIILPASVEPFKSITVPVEVPGAVEWLGVEEGSAVREGQEIARLEMRALKAELERAKAGYELAQSDFRRVEKLLEANTASQEQYDLVKSQVAVAKGTLDVAQTLVDKAAIFAPAAGVLNRRFVEVGEYVKVGEPLAEIVQVDRVKVVVYIPEKDIAYVNVGTLLGILLNGNIDNPLPDKVEGNSFADAVKQAVADRALVLGAVTYRSIVADDKTRTFRVEVTVANPDKALLPGMIVRTVILRRMIENAIAVPLIAVVPREGRAVVYVEKEGRAVERTVTLGVTDGRNIQILSGLAAGDNLIVQGQRLLKDGTLLKVVKPNGTAANGAARAPSDTPASTDQASGTH